MIRRRIIDDAIGCWICPWTGRAGRSLHGDNEHSVVDAVFTFIQKDHLFRGAWILHGCEVSKDPAFSRRGAKSGLRPIHWTTFAASTHPIYHGHTSYSRKDLPAIINHACVPGTFEDFCAFAAIGPKNTGFDIVIHVPVIPRTREIQPSVDPC